MMGVGRDVYEVNEDMGKLGLGLGVHIRVLCKLADANNSKLHTLKVRLQRARQIHAHPL